MNSTDSRESIGTEKQWEVLSLVLYLLIIVESVIFIVLFEFIYVVFISFLLIGVLWLRRLVVDDPISKLDQLRTILSNLLGNSLISDNSDENFAEVKDKPLNNFYNPLLSEDLKNIIPDLRKIGIDGLLILMLLTKNPDRLSGINIIEKQVQIPTSTLYRNINKLEKSGLIQSHQLVDQPGKNYYNISELGLSQVQDLHVIVNQLTVIESNI